MLAQHHHIIRESLSAHDGREIDTQGDAFFATFDSPRECIRAVIETQRALGDQRWPGGERVAVRMGVHCGEAAETTTGLVGLDVHRAARVAAVAHGGQVIVTSSVAELVRSFLPEGASLRDLGEHRLKDLSQPERIFQVLSVGLRSEFPPLRSLDNPALPNNLPVQPSSFVGREQELFELRDLVKNNRLVTLTGAGGCGKTRLGLNVVAELLDGSGEGVWLVELASVADENTVATAISDVLGIGRRPDRSPLDALLEGLASQRAMILLDNCEHLIAGCAKVTDAILRRCPQIHLVVTSREPLGISGETIYRVPPMSLPDEDEGDGRDATGDSDAVALFVERARAQGVRLELDEAGSRLVVQVCRRLDGMPLAIELAAARLRALSPASLLERLDQRFRLLTGGSRTALPRQQTLLATVDWSYSLLSSPEQNVLCRLSVFVDGFDLEAAETVGGLDDIEVFAVTGLLTSLVDKSLVVAQPSNGSIRYQLLETIRQFASERLIDQGEAAAAAVRDAHSSYFLALAEQGGARPYSNQPADWYRRLAANPANIRQAIEYAAGDPDVAGGTARVLRFASALHRYLISHYMHEVAQPFFEVLERPESRRDLTLRARALITAGLLSRRMNMQMALGFADQAMQIAVGADDDRLHVEAALNATAIYYFSGSLERSYRFGQEAVQQARRYADDALLGTALTLFMLPSDRLHPENTPEMMAEAITLSDRSGDVHLAGLLYNNACARELRAGHIDLARRHLEKAASAWRLVVVDYEEGELAFNFGLILRQSGEHREAVAQFEYALQVSHRTANKDELSCSMLGLACTAGDSGEWRRATVLHGFADALLADIGATWEYPEDIYRQESIDRAVSELGATGFAAAYSEGGALDLKSAVDLALRRT